MIGYRNLSAAKVVILMMVFTLVTKFLGFIREVMLGQAFGTSYITDAYIIALSIPTIIFSAILAAISTTFIPVYSKIKNNNGIMRANYFTNNLLFLILMVSLIIIFFGYYFSDVLVNILGSGISSQGIDLAISLTKIGLLMLPTLAIISVLSVYLQAEGKFIVTSFINIPIIVVVVIAFCFASYIGIKGIMIANIIGSILQVFILIFAVKRIGFNFKFRIDLGDNSLKEMFLLIGPVLIGTSVQQINLMIDRMLASNFGDGIISGLSFGSKINEMFFGIISVTIATFIFPKLSNLASKQSMNDFNNLVKTSLNTVSIIVLPLVFIVLFNSKLIVELLFERGAFDSSSTLITSNSLFYYSIGMLFFGYRDVLNRTFYSMGDTKTSMKNAILTVFCNIIFSLILMNIIGYKGLALATSLAGIITCCFLFINLKKKLNAFKYVNFMADQFKILLAAIGMITITQIIYNFITSLYSLTVLFNIIVLSISLLIGGILYIILLIFFKLKEIQIIKEGIFKKFSTKG